MADATLYARIRTLGKTKQEWLDSTLILLENEMAIETDTGMFKFGNNEDVYSVLPYARAEAAGDSSYMKIEVYDTNSDGVIDKAESLKGANNTIVVVNDSGTDTQSLWTADKINTEIQNVKDNYIPSSEKATANGVATLDENGLVPSSQLPSYVDDVIEADDFASLPTTGEAGKIYVTKDDNKTYRWSGTIYTVISDTIALGETTGTAYEGSKGKANADAITALRTDLDSLTNEVGTLGALAHKDTVAADDIDANAVTTVKILDANVTESKLADSAVTTDKIAVGAVTNAKIVSIDQKKITQVEGEYLILDCNIPNL